MDLIIDDFERDRVADGTSTQSVGQAGGHLLTGSLIAQQNGRRLPRSSDGRHDRQRPLRLIATDFT
jgi:hypothetical protein